MPATPYSMLLFLSFVAWDVSPPPLRNPNIVISPKLIWYSFLLLSLETSYWKISALRTPIDSSTKCFRSECRFLSTNKVYVFFLLTLCFRAKFSSLVILPILYLLWSCLFALFLSFFTLFSVYSISLKMITSLITSTITLPSTLPTTPNLMWWPIAKYDSSSLFIL